MQLLVISRDFAFIIANSTLGKCNAKKNAMLFKLKPRASDNQDSCHS